MRTHSVGIKMCGGCNPRIDRSKLVMNLSAYLEPRGHRIYLRTKNVDMLICISGCSANCADEDLDADVKKTIVAGESVDAYFVNENSLRDEIIRKEAKLYG